MALIKARKSVIRNCLTCPICNHLMERPTAITICSHVFCRKCIHYKIDDKGEDFCPLCHTKLGRLPAEKLREDHALQNIIVKLLHDRRNTQSAELLVTSPDRLRKRALSSLDGGTKALARKADSLRHSDFSLQECIESKEDTLEDFQDSLYIPENLSKTSQDKIQIFPYTEPYNNASSKECSGKTYCPLDGKPHKSKFLRDLAETSNGSQVCDSTSSDVHIPMSQHLGNTLGSDVPVSSKMVNKTKGKKRGRKKRVTFQDQEVIDPVAVEATNLPREIDIGPIWFRLVASEKQAEHASFPPIYLRIKVSW